MASITRIALASALVILVCGMLQAQVLTGTPSFSRIDAATGPDEINLANLNAHIAVPVLHKPGRGTDFTYDLSYDTSIWYPVGVNGTTTWQPVYNWGWGTQTQVVTGYSIDSHVNTIDWEQNYTCYKSTWTFVYYDAWGATHTFGPGIGYTGTHGACSQANGHGECPLYSGACFYGYSGTANDGSGYSLVVNPNMNNCDCVNAQTLYDRGGHVILTPQQSGIGAATFTDRNGNEITADSSGHFYDTLSSTTPVLTVSAPAPPSSTTFTYTAPSGGSASYTMKFASYNVQTNFGCSNIAEYGSNGTTTAYLVNEIDLPDTSKYTFTYEATPGHSGYVTGRLASITLPTGGTIAYAYMGNNNGIFCADGSTAGMHRTTPDTGSNYWSYSRSGTLPATTTSITDPQGNETISNFSGIYETQRQVFQGTSTLLETLVTCYNNNFTNCPAATVTLPITKRDVYRYLPGLANPALSETTYGNFGELTEDKEFDFVPISNGQPFLSDTKVGWEYVNTFNAFAQQTTTTNNAGIVVAQRTITLDQGSVTPTSGTPNHTSVTTARGNPTSISYLVSGSATLTQSFSYFDTGNVNVATDVNGAQTTYAYGACGNSFPTSISEPLGLSKSIAWNCNGGVATSVRDENGNSVTATYSDADFWRPASTMDELNNSTTFTYTGQTQVETTMNFNGATSTTNTLVTLDGMGRTHITQAKQSQSSSTYDSMETDYDALSRPYKITTPYSASAGQLCSGTCNATTTTYDPLGRNLTVTDAGGGTVTYSYSQNDVLVTLGPRPTGENTKSRQIEYDGLGRLTSVCELTSTLPGNGTCAQNTSQTGYWTKYTYDANGNLTGVTQNAQAAGSSQQTRTYAYDGLSRMVSETNPEAGNATVYYFFDSDPGTKGAANCSGGYSGDLVKTVDASGNVLCNTYDALHRNTSTTYPAGPNSSLTLSRHFVYDAATVNGASMANAKTRIAEAYTTSSSCISNCTDIGFSYTVRGEVADVYESTQHSGGYYHVPASYWANGVLNNLNTASCNSQPCLAGLPAFAYGADGEGRTNSVTAGSGQSPVTGTNYNFYNSPPQVKVTFGSGDSDIFNYDANTWRMTQYQFNVGSQPRSVVGALAWNANGSLGSLTITDPFNTGNVQTCTYVHDDVQRIGGSSTPGVKCMNGSQTVWSNTLTYDAFGNINKSGTSSFNASYNSATNRMTTVGSCTPTYDSNGDVTNDCLNIYTWDANGRPLTINGVGATYDALGRVAELNRSGTYYEIVYDPTGNKLALMNGQSLVKAFVPLIEGGVAVYTSSGLDHYRHSDWLGNARLFSSPGQTVLGEVAYSPFGETYAQTGLADFSFTGLNDDSDPTNPATVYDFPAREYGIQGRWPSPDPVGLGSVDPANPQSWNRYAYVLNNPLAYYDPSGLEACGEGEGTGLEACDDGAPPPDEGSDYTSGLPDPLSYGDLANACGTPVCVEVPSPQPNPGVIDLTWLGPTFTENIWDMLPGHTWFVPSQRISNVPAPPVTDSLKLLSLKAAGFEASHDLGCAVSGVAGQIPFAGHALGGALAGQMASAIDETGIVASQSDSIAQGLSNYAGMMRHMGASVSDVRGISIAAGQVAKYGPAFERAARLAKGATFVVGAAASIYDFNQCVNHR